jgi:hypothetical protein
LRPLQSAGEGAEPDKSSGAEPRSAAALPTRDVLATRAGHAAGLFWTFAPLCTIALVIGFVGELSILGPNIRLERDATAGWIIG